ncbi:MAG: crossover junction endodeoxyribonuclease RuvC [Muribaculaceae bacterium]|nr:crossover junction endodeoxyribonuclease RuvC [Muribaculaceae bacterium]
MSEQWDKIIIGIDPGTNVMGYGLLGVKDKKPSLIVMGVLKLSRMEDHYMRLHRIYERVRGLVEQYLPDEMAIEAPFYGKNVQSMLKLGRAQGVAMAAALSREVPIAEYEPRKIKMAITGNGAASKEQVATMLQRELHIAAEQMPDLLDATDALAVALCHFYESQKPIQAHGAKSWKAFIAAHPDRVK